MPDENVQPREPRPPEQTTLLGSTTPDELFARAMQTVKMTSGTHGTWQPPSVEEANRLFPNYTVLGLLGRGGMGAVYKAKQTALDRLVAVKLLPMEISVDQDFADRFVREARATARLNHPNIVTVHDFGTTPEGHLFFIMEYVEGANLADMIHQVGLDGNQALSVVEQVCTALAYAHAKGIVHRDIKPANVMIDTESHVKVADFGLARLTGPDTEQLGHTMTGAVMGTPDYMAPEQMRGMNVDHRADIYSVGVMLYEMLCREVPKGIFDPPSHRTGCDARIDQIVIKAMQQAPDRRYQSSTEMKLDIITARVPGAAPESTPINVAPASRSPPKSPALAANIGGQTPPLPPKPLPPGLPKKSATPRPPDERQAPDATAGKNDQPAEIDSLPPHPPRPAVIKVISPTDRKKSKLPLSGVIAAAVVFAMLLCKFTKPRHSEAKSEAIRSTSTKSEPSNPPGGPLEAATKDAPFVNTLGMKFVPVAITGGPSTGLRELFSIWETRVQDYEAFVQETKREWPKPPFPQGPTHPAVNMNWEDAQAFCAWLTAREHQTGRLGETLRYRLPTDHEWSCAVGLGELEDAAKTPEEKDDKVADVFPWGNVWPPPPGAGNYSGEEVAGHEELKASDLVREQKILTGYRDDFPFTAPVGSFAANRWGLFDLGGNAWEWCEDRFNPKDERRVLRGASFAYAERRELLSSVRGPKPPALHNFNCGFRVILAEMMPAAATKEAPFVNGLGMKFVPVAIGSDAGGGPADGQKVLFSVWKTRVQDYEIFVKETQREWLKPRFSQAPTHPVTDMSWNDAQAFCKWLTERERKAGRLAAGFRYRLPSDHEWSCAVGIGDREDPAKTPEEKSGKIADVFPWGAAWPPPPGAGNFSGEEAAGHEAMKEQKILTGYRDDFTATAPVGSFAANGLGIFDAGGNAWEWCEDPYKSGSTDRVLRGSSWAENDRSTLLSSFRSRSAPGDRRNDYGFRCVLASESSTATAAAVPN